MQGSREVIASTVFVPAGAGAVVVGYMKNCNGGLIKKPLVVVLGHWRVFVPQDLADLETSITARSGRGANLATRNVSVALTRNTGPGAGILTVPLADTTMVDIYVRDVPTDVLQGDSTVVEVTLARLPL